MDRPKIQKVTYDNINDVVYISFSDQKNSYGDDISDNVVIRRDWDSDKITGLTILQFKKMLKEKSDEISLIPFPINFESEILPFC